MHNTDFRKLVIVGDVGSGKTQLITTLSQIDTINTDVNSTVDIGKATTTVGIDYGRISISDDSVLGLYGVPGQERYSFVWNTVKQGIWGMILLLRADSSFDSESFLRWIRFFEVQQQNLPLIVAISHSDQVSDEQYQTLQNSITEQLKRLQLSLPLLPVDCRDQQQSLTLLSIINTLAN